MYVYVLYIHTHINLNICIPFGTICGFCGQTVYAGAMDMGWGSR
jgi:hypothetical protein